MSGSNVFSLQELLGHEDMETIRNYMHLADANAQSQKRKFSRLRNGCGDYMLFLM